MVDRPMGLQLMTDEAKGGPPVPVIHDGRLHYTVTRIERGGKLSAAKKVRARDARTTTAQIMVTT
jgi:hypothetical protein